MVDEAKATDATVGGEQTVSGKAFTQDELNRIITDRLAQERKKYADYEDLKKKASEFDKIAEAQKSETDKLREAASKAQQERDAALSTANERMLRASFIAEAAKANVAYPEDAYALADKSNVKIGDDGNAIGVVEAVKSLVDAGRLPLGAKPVAPNLNAGAGSGERTRDLVATLTPEEQTVARKMGITAEAYAKSKQAIRGKKE